MPRIHRWRTVTKGSTNHCMWRSHNGEKVFKQKKFARKFLYLLGKYKDRYGVKIHSFCLMGTHPHVMMTATKGQVEFSRFWKVVNWCFATFYNKEKKRSGQVVRERLKSPTVLPAKEGERSHQLTVMVYGDLNPVRAGLEKDAADWPFSSHMHYAYGHTHPLIDDAPDYVALGEQPGTRRKKYRELFNPKRKRAMRHALMKRRPDLEVGAYVGETAENARLRRERWKAEAAAAKKPPS